MHARPLSRLLAVLTTLAILAAAIPAGVAHANGFSVDVEVCQTDPYDCTNLGLLSSETTFLAIKQLAAGYFGIPAACMKFEIDEGTFPQDNETLGTYFLSFGELTIWMTPQCASSVEPTPLYMLWFLVAADNTACLLFSPTHPSIESQGGWCFPEEYDNSWVAVRSCGGFVYSDGSWKCQADYDEWLFNLLQGFFIQID